MPGDLEAAVVTPRNGLQDRRASEVKGKLDRVRVWLVRKGRDAVLVGSQAGFAWITAGGRSHVSIGEEAGIASVLVTREGAHLLTTNIELHRLADEEIDGLPFEQLQYPWYEPDEMVALLDDRCDRSRTVSDIGQQGLPAAGPDFASLRFTLGLGEIDRYRALGRDATLALEAACREAGPGDTELDIAARIAAEAVRRDILPLVDLVATDDRIARYRHPIPTANRFHRTLLAALTGRRHGLHASLTRMRILGQPDDDLAARHAAVSRVDAAYLIGSMPGADLGGVMRLAIDRYRNEGQAEEWRLHHQGGLTGYAGREIFATPSERHVLEPGQALAWNPSITRVKSEDTVLVTEDGVEVLTKSDTWPQVPAHIADRRVERPALLVEGS